MLLSFRVANVLSFRVEQSLSFVATEFHGPGGEPRKAQMIFTSHDATLLYILLGTDRVLQRDTVWLTEKRPDGATDLYPLTSLARRPARETICSVSTFSVPTEEFPGCLPEWSRARSKICSREPSASWQRFP